MSAYPAFTYGAWLTKLVDGDTLHCGVDLGLDIATNLTVRLYGINAPEMSTDEGKAAKAYVAQWFAEHSPDGKFVIATVKDKREKYGRYLGVIFGVDGENLNEDMVATGHAVPYFPTVAKVVAERTLAVIGHRVPVTVNNPDYEAN